MVLTKTFDQSDGLDHYRYGDLSRAQVWNRLLEDVNLILEADYSVWRAEFDLDGCAA